MNFRSSRDCFFALAALLLLCGCPGPRKPAHSPAQPPVLGARDQITSSNTVATTDKGDWFRWRGPNANGVSSDTNWNPKFSGEGPKQIWKAQAGTGFSSVSISNGKAYTMGNLNDIDIVWCFDATTGQTLWKHEYPTGLDPKYYEGGPSATPTVDGSAVYTLSKNGDIYCLDANSGKVVWSKNLSTELKAEIPSWGFASSVLVEGNLAIVNVGEFGTALDKNNGKVVWTSGKDASGYGTPVPFEYSGLKAVAIFAANSIAGVKTSDGTLLWKHPWKTSYDVNAADPVVAGNLVFVSSSYGTGCGLIDFSNNKPTLAWKSKQMRNHYNSCVLVGDHIYGIDGHADEKTPRLKCLELKTGTVKWAEPIMGTGTLIAAGDKLIVLAGRGELITAETNPAAFKEISRAQVIGGRCWTAPALSNGRLYVRNAQGTLICLDLSR